MRQYPTAPPDVPTQTGVYSIGSRPGTHQIAHHSRHLVGIQILAVAVWDRAGGRLELVGSGLHALRHLLCSLRHAVRRLPYYGSQKSLHEVLDTIKGVHDVEGQLRNVLRSESGGQGRREQAFAGARSRASPCARAKATLTTLLLLARSPGRATGRLHKVTSQVAEPQPWFARLSKREPLSLGFQNPIKP